MTLEYAMIDLMLYLILYAFLGWGVQVIWIALRDRHFFNRGLLNLPLNMSCGITSVILLLVLPTLEGHPVQQLFAGWIIMGVVHGLTSQFVRSISHRSAMAQEENASLAVRIGLDLVQAMGYLLLYLLIHPFVFTFVNWLPDGLAAVLTAVAWLLVVMDYIGVFHALRTNRVPERVEERKKLTQRLGDRMTRAIWERLEKAYPGVEQMEPESISCYTFARGICFDKLVWVFLISSFLGALIEMVYCRVTGGRWMSRSSVLYGPFSIVWGFGAVVLTVVLQRLAGKEDRKVFLAGFVVGGAYEYLCSVFTELVFGTVFWDYSHFPLNIGGRTNVLYCIFWGILAVVWLKVLYPPMDRAIEKIPPLLGKIITWVIVFVILSNGLLTACAMERYTRRQVQPEPANFMEEFLDTRYDDSWMEQRWPNMKIRQ